MEFDDRDGLEPLGFVGKDCLEGLGDCFEEVVFEVIVDRQLLDFTLNVVQVVVIMRDVDHATTRYSGRGCGLKVFNLKKHSKFFPEFDSFTVGQTQGQVVIEDSVEILNPEGIDWAIEGNPVMGFIFTVVALSDDRGHKAVGPLLREDVDLAIKLAHGD